VVFEILLQYDIDFTISALEALQYFVAISMSGWLIIGILA